MIGPALVLVALNEDPAAREAVVAHRAVRRRHPGRRSRSRVSRHGHAGWSFLDITTTADRKRRFLLSEAAQEKLEKVPRPAEPQGIDTAHQPRSLLWYSSVVTILSPRSAWLGSSGA